MIIVILHIIGHRLLFQITEYLVKTKLPIKSKISHREFKEIMMSQEKMRSMSSAIIDGIYCYILLQHGKIGPEGSYIMGIFIIVFWVDFHFYVTHRFMHWSEFLYKHVHYIHHQSHNPNVWSSLSFHPVEAIIFFSAYLIVLIVPMPSILFWSFKFGMVIGPLHAHIGYDLGPIVKGPAHHYLHHAFKMGNYGGFPTGIWDKLFDTELNDDGKPNNSSNNNISTPIDDRSSYPVQTYFFFFLIVQLLFDYDVPIWIVILSLLITWIALLDGMLVIFPSMSQRKWKKKKVFVIGLSRTGTTSITEALNNIGICTHHFCGPLVKIANDNYEIVDKYVDNLDGHTDIAPTIVAETLAQKYPEAVFIYTTRPRNEWARALVRFVTEEPRRTLFTTHPTPKTFYSAAYGDGWVNYDEEQWGKIHDAHEKRMQRLKRQIGNKRFLKIDLTSLGKKGKDETMWNAIGNFLQVDVSNAPKKFPHRFVFQYSAIDQPKRQMKYLLHRIVSRKWVLLLLWIFVYVGRFFDSGQCTRACRVWNGNNPLAPLLAGTTGNWFEPADVYGLRIGYDTCKCYGNNEHIQRDVIPRLHLEVATKDQWWFKADTTAVCSSNGQEYDNALDVPTSDTVTNCGKCGKCSSVNDVDAMHTRAETLTKRASVGALLYLFAGKGAHNLFFQSSIVGFSPACAKCWLLATQCNLASCAEYCLFGWENPLSTESATSEGKLNSCMHCDEVKCSGYYLQSCGTNRRAAGVVTDIQRDEGMEICIEAKNGAKKRQTTSN